MRRAVGGSVRCDLGLGSGSRALNRDLHVAHPRVEATAAKLVSRTMRFSCELCQARKIAQLPRRAEFSFPAAINNKER